MQVPAGLLTELTDVIDALSAELQPKAKAVVDEIARRHADSMGLIPSEGVAAFRADVVAAMDALCSGATDIVAAYASELYDRVRSTAGAASSYVALAESFRDPAKTDGAIRALVESVARTGTAESFLEACASRLDYEMRRAAAECMVGNARRDPLRPKWARVPSGRETCPFCLMLASFGATYDGEDSVSHVHANCDCRMVQVYDGMTVDGYDPDRAYVQTEKCLETIGGRDGLRRDWEKLPAAERAKAVEKRGGSESKAFGAYVNKRLSAEMGTRDVEWLRTGKEPKVRFENRAVREDKLKNHMDEVWSCIRLRRHGIDTILVRDEVSYYDASKKMNQTRSYADLKNGVELKVLKSSTSINTLNGYLKDASKKKENATSIVFDNFNNRYLNDDDLIEMLKATRSFSRGKVYVLTKEEKLIRAR